MERHVSCSCIELSEVLVEGGETEAGLRRDENKTADACPCPLKVLKTPLQDPESNSSQHRAIVKSQGSGSY